MYKLNKELVIVSTSSDLSSYRGKKVKVVEILPPSNANGYVVEFEDGKVLRVREDEVAEIKPEFLWINVGNVVEYIPTNEKVSITEVDYLYGKVEIEHADNSQQVVDLDVLRKIEQEKTSEDIYNNGEVVESSLENNQKNGIFQVEVDQLGKLIELFLGHYKNQDDTYTVPKQLLVNMFKFNLKEV